MKRNSVLLLFLIGLSVVAIGVHGYFVKQKDISKEILVSEVDNVLYSVHEEDPQIDIELAKTGYEVLDDWIKNNAVKMETQYREDVGKMGEDIGIQKPILRVLLETNEWDQYVNAEMSVYVYTSGAHGMPYVETAVLNKNTGAIVGLGDVFGTGEYLHKLSHIMIGKVSDLNEVFDGDTVRQALQPSATNFERWKVGPDGVTFFFNPYEVAPFSMGIVSVLITWEEIETFKK